MGHLSLLSVRRLAGRVEIGVWAEVRVGVRVRVGLRVASYSTSLCAAGMVKPRVRIRIQG